MFEFIINCASEKCEIMIMVEAMGHNNYGTNQGDDIKGMLGCEIVNGTTKLKWNLYNPQADKTPSWMPKTGMTLGLDLKGGVHMVLGVDLDKVVKDQVQTYSSSLK